MPKPDRFFQRMANKVAIVTGAGSQGEGFGNGKAIAYTLALEGARVCLVDQVAERAEETRALIDADGGECFVQAADITDAARCEQIVKAVVERYGRVDVLINNVGIAAPSISVADLDMDSYDHVMNVNVRSAILMCKYAVPEMIRAGGGSIVNISSIASMVSAGTIPYGASKGALNALSNELAVIHGRDGIRVNTVAPGHVFTPLLADLCDRGMMKPEDRETRRKVAPLGVEGDSWDVAAAVLFLASDDARFLTGLLLPVDGGLTMVAPMKAHALINS